MKWLGNIDKEFRGVKIEQHSEAQYQQFTRAYEDYFELVNGNVFGLPKATDNATALN